MLSAPCHQEPKYPQDILMLALLVHVFLQRRVRSKLGSGVEGGVMASHHCVDLGVGADVGATVPLLSAQLPIVCG